MHTKISSATTIGIDTHLIDVEVDLSLGLLQFFIVGLPDMAVKESRQRIHTALKNCGIKLPDRRITVNLAPAALKKEGTLFDLPIAFGIILAAHIISVDNAFLQETLFLGELSLDGSVKAVKGVLPIACDAQALGKKRIVIPHANIIEASLIKNLEVVGIKHLLDLVKIVQRDKIQSNQPAAEQSNTVPIHYITEHVSQIPTNDDSQKGLKKSTLDFSDVKGQQTAKRALQIAAAGKHNILFIGSPGSGKTMLAQRLPSIMPPLSFEEILETSKVYSISGKLVKSSLITERPFRSPHHTITQAGMVGGGAYPQPGEISLAHNGVLFLDELTEFKREVLELLRQPLEEHTICLARINQTTTFPASFLLVAALNPCPCGFLMDKKRTCVCSQQQLNKYQTKLSGPLLDRIDLQVSISSIDYGTLTEHQELPIDSATLFKGVQQAHNLQQQRAQKREVSFIHNGYLTPKLIEEYCVLDSETKPLIQKAFDRLHLTMRGYHKLLKVSRTIADIEGSEQIKTLHVQEALMYRSIELDKREFYDLHRS